MDLQKRSWWDKKFFPFTGTKELPRTLTFLGQQQGAPFQPGWAGDYDSKPDDKKSDLEVSVGKDMCNPFFTGKHKVRESSARGFAEELIKDVLQKAGRWTLKGGGVGGWKARHDYEWMLSL